MQKHSIKISGHATSVSLEEAFWEELQIIALRKCVSVNQLVTEIDSLRQNQENLSSAIRLYVLNSLRADIEKLKII